MSDSDERSDRIGIKSLDSSASWRIRATQPDGTMIREMSLADGMTIGRGLANTIRVSDSGSGMVERNHARIDRHDDGSFVLKCLPPNAVVETDDGLVSILPLELGGTFRISETRFEIVAGSTSAQAAIASVGRGCPYCGQTDLPVERGVATTCLGCGRSVVVVPPDQKFNFPTFLPGTFHDGEGGEYRVESFFARGGMGYVLKGNDEDWNSVAIKVLILEGNADGQNVSRFEQEIDLLRKLHDPNVVRIKSHGQEAGLFFFVMDWIDGQDLRTKIFRPGEPETHVDFTEVLGWFEQACLGLYAIHRAGIVHRDIKPSNLLLRSDGQLLIADLGVAKRLDDGETGMTRTGQLPGTYNYMSPEQLRAPDKVDQRTDIYSLGLTFWELLTGFRHQGADPETPSEVNTTVPPWFDDILREMLRGSLDRRPSTMLDVLRLLPSPTNRTAPSTRTESACNSFPTNLSLKSGMVVAPDERGKGEGTAGVDTQDHIVRAEVVLWSLYSQAKTGLRFLRPRIVQLRAHLAKIVSELRHGWKSTIATWKSANKPQSTSNRHNSANDSTDAAAGHNGTGTEADETVTNTAWLRHRLLVSVLNSSGFQGVARWLAGFRWQRVSKPRGATIHPVQVHPTAQAPASESDSAQFIGNGVARGSRNVSQEPTLETEAARAKENIEAILNVALALPEGSKERVDALTAARRDLILTPLALRSVDIDRHLKPKIERYLEAALRAQGDEAFAANRHGPALFYYQELCQLSLADKLVTDRIDHIIALRRSAFERAATALRRGYPRPAREQILQLQSEFTDDPSFMAECEQMLAKIRLIKQRVKETIPALRATKSLFRLCKLLEELATDKIVIPGLDELLEKTRQTLSDGSRKLGTVQRLLDDGDLDGARKVIEKVRSKIADHPEADELTGKVDAEDRRQKQIAEPIRALAASGNLGRVYRMLQKESPKGIERLGLKDLFGQAIAYKRRSDRFIRLLAWFIGGSVSIVVASYFSAKSWPCLMSLFVGNSKATEFVKGVESSRYLSFTVISLVTYMTMCGIRELFGRPEKSRSIRVDVAFLIACVAIFEALEVGPLKPFVGMLVNEVVRRSPSVVSKAQIEAHVEQLTALLGSAVILASSITSFSRLGVDLVSPKAVVPLRLAILGGIAIAAAGAFAPLGLAETSQHGDNPTRGSVLGIVPSTMLAMAAASVLCPVGTFGIISWPLVAAIFWFVTSKWANVEDFSYLSEGSVVWSLVLACGIFLGLHRHTRGTAISALGIAIAAVGMASYLVSQHVPKVLLPMSLVWSAACLIVSSIAQADLIRKLDVYECLADLRQWLFSTIPRRSPRNKGEVY